MLTSARFLKSFCAPEVSGFYRFISDSKSEVGGVIPKVSPNGKLSRCAVRRSAIASRDVSCVTCRACDVARARQINSATKRRRKGRCEICRRDVSGTNFPPFRCASHLFPAFLWTLPSKPSGTDHAKRNETEEGIRRFVLRSSPTSPRSKICSVLVHVCKVRFSVPKICSWA